MLSKKESGGQSYTQVIFVTESVKTVTRIKLKSKAVPIPDHAPIHDYIKCNNFKTHFQIQVINQLCTYTYIPIWKFHLN